MGMASQVKEASASQAPGNTKARRFQLTLNQVDRWDELRNYLESLRSLRYGIACSEDAPTTGHKHIHCFVVFNNMIKLSVDKSAGAHIEKCRGSDKQNIDYITDDSKTHNKINNEIIWNYGDEIHQGHRLSSDEIKKMEPIEIVEADPYNAKRLLEVKEILTPLNALNWTKNVKVYYLWGQSGIGKSNWIQNKLFELNIDNYDQIDCSNGFWQGITGLNKVAVYDEFTHESMKPKDFIKFIDYRRQRLNIKGGSKLNDYTMIFIASLEDPEYFVQWHYEDKKQWLRRMEVIHLTELVKLNRELAKKLELDLDKEWIEPESSEMGISL